MKAVILLNGNPPEKELLTRELQGCSLVVCADGAAAWAYNMVKIDTLIGDMDSLGDRLNEIAPCCGEIVRLPTEKDMTDAEEAVRYALKKGAEEIVMLGAIGSRMDHTLGNIQLLCLMNDRKVKGTMADSHNRITVISERTEFAGAKGDLLSIIPIGEGVVVHKTEGLYYPLSEAVMPLTSALGISNVFTEERATVDVSGRCIVVMACD